MYLVGYGPMRQDYNTTKFKNCSSLCRSLHSPFAFIHCSYNFTIFNSNFKIQKLKGNKILSFIHCSSSSQSFLSELPAFVSLCSSRKPSLSLPNCATNRSSPYSPPKVTPSSPLFFYFSQICAYIYIYLKFLRVNLRWLLTQKWVELDNSNLSVTKRLFRSAKADGNHQEEAKWANVIGHILKDRGEYVEALKWI